ncbi:MAG: hypothetical protein IJD13_02840 [Oscillospiraceae bacterium]|nr:hypothetical protein [Oscillospiraceae bacterium]
MTIKDPVDKVFFDFHDGKGEVETSLEAVAAHIDRPVYELEAMVRKWRDVTAAVSCLTASEICGKSICNFLTVVDHTILEDLDLSIKELQKRYMEIFYQGSDNETALRYAIINGYDGEYSRSWLDAVLLSGSRPDAPFYTEAEWNTVLETGKPVYEDQFLLTPEEAEVVRELAVSHRLSPAQAAFLLDSSFYPEAEWNTVLKTEKPVCEDQILLTPEEAVVFRELAVSRRLSPAQAAFLFKRILKTEEKS